MDGLPGEKIIGNVKFQHLYLTMNEKSTNCFILKLASNAVQGFKIINLGNNEINVKQQTVFYITNKVGYMDFLFKLNILSLFYAPTLQCHIQLIKILNILKIITDLK